MRIDLQGFKVAHAKMTGAGFEVISKRQRTKRRVAAGTATVNHRSIWINLGPGREELCSINTVVDIHNAPGSVQSFAIGAAIAGATAVVHIQDSNAAAGPVLYSQHQNGDGGRRWSTVALYQQQR